MHMTKKTRNTMKPPSQTQSSLCEGVYNNARMLHFLTAVVGSTCDVKVKNGSAYEGIFKTLSSRCELAVDAVHKRSEEREGDGGGGEGGGGSSTSTPRIEEITDTMIFSPTDLVTMTCRDVDLNFAIRDTFTDTAISSTRLNGEHREKVLQRWDGGDSNGEGYDLENDASNGWDASEMFKFNEETYGVKSTYDSSLSMYTVPLEKGTSECFRQREARAARLANEIEGCSQYRRRVSLENDEGKSEEEKYSAVVREREERERGSPGYGSSASRDGKYIPLLQRAREMGVFPGSLRGGASGPLPNRTGIPNSSRPVPPSSSPRSSSDKSSSLSVRGAYSPHHSQSSPTASGLPISSNQSLPHSLSHPQALSDVSRSSLNGVNEILSTAAKERPEGLASPQEGKSCKVPSVQQRSQLEELRKFGKEFRLQPSSAPSTNPDAPQTSPTPTSAADSASTAEPKPTSSQDPQTAEGLATNPTAVANQSAGPDRQLPGTPQPARTPGSEDGGEITEGVTDQVKKSTLNPNAKEFNPIKGPMAMQKPSTAPTPPRPSPSLVLQPPPGQTAIYSSPPYLSYVSPIQIQGHSVQAPQIYQYISQGKYPRAKGHLSLFSPGSVVGPRPDHHGSPAPSMIQAAASAAGPPLVASPYPQSYLQYGQVIQAMPHYHGPPMYSMLQGGTRILASGGPPQALGPPGPQYAGQAEGPQGPQQGMYAPQSFSHHSGQLHHPQPSSTPTGSQPPPQHAAPSPGHGQNFALQSNQGGPQSQSMYHAVPLSAPTPPNMPPGHSSPQASFPMQGFSLPSHQSMQHAYSSLAQLTQAHVAAGMSTHHSAGHGPPPVMLHYAAPPTQQGPGSTPQHGPPPQPGAPQHYYIGHPQAVQVQAHPSQQLSFHPPGN
ncbi:ataxin-2-like protein isoform X9 [Osmerus mordax]|uniref:ataxin-2-like protein isoform X9 n=1 Tax=Osmerus mordax TaxID=8014 RepID=UPI00350F1636